MVGDDHERQASPCTRQAGCAARRASGAATRRAGQIRRVRPLLRAHRAEVDASAGHHSRRTRCGVGGAVSRTAQARGGQGPRRDHGRPPRCRDVPPRRPRRRPAARSAHHRPGRQRHRRASSTTRRSTRRSIYGTSYGTYLAAGFGVRHPDRVHAMVLDSPVLSAHDIDAVRDSHPPGAVGRRGPRCRGTGAQGATARRRRRADAPAAGQLTAAMYGFGRTRGADAPTRPAAAAADADCGRCSIEPRDFCSIARRRTATSRTWSAGSGSAN